MATVSYDNVGKVFPGGVEALRDLSLDVEAGEFMVLVGPSGSGKTTALRILAGLERESAGEVRIGDRPVGNVAPQARDIAMVFQDYALYPQMTVAKNLEFGLRMRRMAKEEIASRVQSTAEMLGIGELLERRPRELSGGQRQRVALGRAVVRQPRVFLMDEPLSNLDAMLRTQTRGEIRRLQQELGVTTVYVTHDQVEAMTMGDRIAVLRDGQLVQAGRPTELYEAPVNRFVAGFIGTPAMSFVEVSARVDGDETVLGQGEFCFSARIDSALPKEIVIGIRPEHARLWTGESGRCVGPLKGRVEYIEALGRESFVGVRSANAALVVIQAEGNSPVAIGDTVQYGLELGQLHVFDGVTEARWGRI